MSLNITPLTQEDKKQYQRHIILNEIGYEGQKKIKNSKVLVIGAGGLGCPVLQYLTAAGIGNIGIIDGDIIEIHNLQRQILFTPNDIGKNKAVIAKEKLETHNPLINIKAYPVFLDNNNAIKIFKNYDIIVDGSDNFATRYLVNDSCIITNKPLVFGSIFKFEGQISVFNYKGSGTYRCLFPNPPKANSVPNCSEIGVLGILPGIIGCYQANEVIKIITGIGELLSNQLLVINTLNLNQHILSFKKDQNQKQPTSLLKNYHSFCNTAPNITNKKEIIPYLYIDYKAFLKKSNQYYLIDVRSDIEWEQEHLDNSINIPIDEFDIDFEDFIKNTYSTNKKTIILYCSSQNRSKMAYDMITDKFPDNKIRILSDDLNSIM